MDIPLNSEQSVIVAQPPKQNMRILASAGSGKTTTLTARIAHLIRTGAAVPEQIVLLSFTRNAAGVMRSRLEALIGTTQILCGTFHSLSQQLLRNYTPTELEDIFHVDELPLKALDWMESSSGRVWITQNIGWLFIDEYQDINDTQERFIRALHHPGATVTIVGDDAQNIYTWRGSCVDYILNFHQRFPQVADFQLATNYRSTAAIVAVANSIMRHIPTLPHKQLMTAAQRNAQGDRPEVRYFARTAEERDWITESVCKTLANGQTVAILSKFNSVLYSYEAAFKKMGLRCRFVEADKDNVQTPTVYLSTFHSAKGLEWDNVYLVRMNDEVFPQQKDDDSVLQERRLFYVAVTRARRQLCMTYSRNERSLSRFVREIHRPLLQFMNIPRYELSLLTCVPTPTTIANWVDYLSGEDYRILKKIGCLPSLQPQTQQPLPASSVAPTYVTPHWWTEQGMSAEFSAFIRAFWHRQMSSLRPESGGQWDREAQRVIWTIKIAAEDAAVFVQHRKLIESLAHLFFSGTPPGTAPPQIYWTEIVNAIGPTGLEQPELIRIIQIIHKMRTMLYNLRFASITLEELQFAPIRHSPPQESRCALIEAWRLYTNGISMESPQPTTEELRAVYQIGLCRSLAMGRSAVVAELPGETQFKRCRAFLTQLTEFARSLSEKAKTILCRVQTELQGNIIAEADMLIDETAWFLVSGDQPTELQRLDYLIICLLTVHLLRSAGHKITALTLWQPITDHKLTWSVADWSTQKAQLMADFIEARVRHSTTTE